MFLLVLLPGFHGLIAPGSNDDCLISSTTPYPEYLHLFTDCRWDMSADPRYTRYICKQSKFSITRIGDHTETFCGSGDTRILDTWRYRNDLLWVRLKRIKMNIDECAGREDQKACVTQTQENKKY